MPKKVKRAKKVAGATPQDPVYVGVHEPTQIQRSVLLTTKDLLELIKEQQHIAEIRKHKIHAFNHFLMLIKTIKDDLRQLKQVIPKSTVRTVHKHAPKPKPMPAQKPVEEVREKHLNALDKELAEIEGALEDLKN